MFRKSCTNLTTVPKQEVISWLKAFETIIFDADGVLWYFNKPVEGSIDVFNKVQEAGKQAFIVTNNSSLTCDGLIKKATKMGYKVKPDHMFNSARSVSNFLATKKFEKKVFVIGDAPIMEELQKRNICSFRFECDESDKTAFEIATDMEMDPDVGAVVMGTDYDINVGKIIRAAAYLNNPNTLFLGTTMDSWVPLDNKRLIVVAGALIAMVKTMTGRKPFIVGKPNPWMLHELLSCGLIVPEKTLMIGDTLVSDILFANHTGFSSLFVGSGVNSLKDVDKYMNSEDKNLKEFVPDTYLPHVGLLNKFLD